MDPEYSHQGVSSTRFLLQNMTCTGYQRAPSISPAAGDLPLTRGSGGWKCLRRIWWGLEWNESVKPLRSVLIFLLSWHTERPLLSPAWALRPAEIIYVPSAPLPVLMAFARWNKRLLWVTVPALVSFSPHWLSLFTPTCLHPGLYHFFSACACSFLPVSAFLSLVLVW